MVVNLYIAVQEDDNSNNCSCLPECEKLTYSFTEKEWPLDPVELCKPGGAIFAYINGKASLSWYRKAIIR